MSLIGIAASVAMLIPTRETQTLRMKAAGASQTIRADLLSVLLVLPRVTASDSLSCLMTIPLLTSKIDFASPFE